MHLLVHGGAGSAPAAPAERQAALESATAAAGDDRENPRAAALSAVRPLERDPRFNAGVGGAVQADGVVRTDAGVMTGTPAEPRTGAGACGAACAMPGVAHAADVAATVADETPHVLVAGDGAVDLANQAGIETNVDLLTDETRTRWRDADPPESDDAGARIAWVREHFGGTDTVGAVASDGETVAAVTSTAGRWFALPGRVGDVPQVGAGFFAGKSAAASATGEGEAIAGFGLARRVVRAVEEGEDPQHAADRMVRGFEAATDATAGVIVVDREGRTGEAHNADAMQTAEL